MANIHGYMWIVDEPNVNVIHQDLQTNYLQPTHPMAGMPGTIPHVLCMNMDETDDTLDNMYPNSCMKATVLCPPPSAMYKEIDGDHEGFVEEYMSYLASEIPSEFIAAMIYILYKGGTIVLYTPSYIEDDSIWTTTLMNYIFCEFGITIGLFPKSEPAYDERYDIHIAETLYLHNCIDVFEFISITPVVSYGSVGGLSYNPQNVIFKVISDLAPICNEEDNPYQLYAYLSVLQEKRKEMLKYNNPGFVQMLKPGITFVK